jgi:hypothetical protein
MTDFLDQLEDELRVAHERRGQPRRRRPPTGALKAVAALAVVALIVVGVARLANTGDTEQSAAPPETRTHGVAVATGGDPGLLDVVAAPLESKLAIAQPPAEGARTADPSLGTVVLYRPGHEDTARFAAHVAKIDRVEPLTEAHERQIDFEVGERNVVVVYGAEAVERVLEDPEICQTGGRSMALCTAGADQASRFAFVVGDRAVPVEAPEGIGRWRWAAVSPDGRTILAQWDADCPRAFAIDAGTGARRELGTGETLGWTTDGRAIVSGACGERGQYLYSLDGSRERWAGPKDGPAPLRHHLDLRG